MPNHRSDPLALLARRRARPGFSVKLADDAYAADTGAYALAAPAVDEPPELDRGAMAATFVFSTQDVDRSGDVVVTAGIDLSAHRKNPVGLFDHGKGEAWKAPIGKWEDPDGNYTCRLDLNRNRAVGKLYFAQSYPPAQDLYRLVDERILRGASIGYLPKRAEPMPGAGADADEDGGPLLLHEVQVVEISLVPVPDNAGALRVAAEKGFGGRRLRPETLRGLQPYLTPSAPLVTGGWDPTDRQTRSPEARTVAKGIKSGEFNPMDDDGRVANDQSAGDGLDEGGVADGGAAVRARDGADGDGDPGDGPPPVEGPPGAVAIHSVHDRLVAVADELERQSKLQENPAVQKALETVAQHVTEAAAELTDTYGSEYPELPAPESPEAAQADADEDGSGETGDDELDGDDAPEDGKDVEATPGGEMLDDEEPVGAKSWRGVRLTKSLRRAVRARRRRALKAARMRTPGLHRGHAAICAKAADFCDEVAGHQGDLKPSQRTAASAHAERLRGVVTKGADGGDDGADDGPTVKQLRARLSNAEADLVKAKAIAEKAVSAAERYRQIVHKLKRS